MVPRSTLSVKNHCAQGSVISFVQAPADEGERYSGAVGYSKEAGPEQAAMALAPFTCPPHCDQNLLTWLLCFLNRDGFFSLDHRTEWVRGVTAARSSYALVERQGQEGWECRPPQSPAYLLTLLPWRLREFPAIFQGTERCTSAMEEIIPIENKIYKANLKKQWKKCQCKILY